MKTRYLRSRLALACAAAGLTAALLSAPAEAAGDAKGPGCADIVNGVGVWDGTTVSFGLSLARLPCRNVTYKVYATPEVTGGITVASTTYTVDSLGRLVFSLAVPDPDPSTACTLVDVYATTSSGRHVADRAPDTGAAQIPDNASCGTPSRDFH